MLAGFVSDRFGRRKVLFACAILYALSGLLSAVPRSFPEFLAARFLSGLGIGASSMICPIYIAEMAPAARRGRLGSLFQLGIVSGIFLTLFINATIQSGGDESWNTTTGWRWMLAAEVAPAMLLLALLFFVPESPRWLIGAGREPEARRILEEVGGPEHARQEIAAVREVLGQEEGRLGELFGPRFRAPLIVAVLLMAFSQFSGLNATMYYSTKIFTTAGVGVTDSFKASVVIGLINDSPRVGPAVTFWIYAAFSLAGLLFVFLMLPETRGRTLEQIEAFWGRTNDKGDRMPSRGKKTRPADSREVPRVE